MPAPKARPPVDDRPAPSKSSKIGWLLGWVVVPLTIIGLLFGAGVHVGARNPDMWLSRATLWVFSKQAQRGPQTAEEARPLGERLRLLATPKQDYGLLVDLSAAELEAIAKQLGTSVDKLECEAVCKAHWQAQQPQRQFLAASRCSLTPAKDQAPAKLDCNAKVERELQPAKPANP